MVRMATAVFQDVKACSSWLRGHKIRGWLEETGLRVIDVDEAKNQSFDIRNLDKYGRGDMDKKIVVDFQNIALRIEGKPVGPHPQARKGAGKQR